MVGATFREVGTTARDSKLERSRARDIEGLEIPGVSMLIQLHGSRKTWLIQSDEREAVGRRVEVEKSESRQGETPSD